MKKSIILLSAVFVLGIITWASSPSLFVETQKRMSQLVQGQKVAVSGQEKKISSQISNTNTGSSRASESIFEEDNTQRQIETQKIEETQTVQVPPTSQSVQLNSFRNPDASYRAQGQLVLRTEGSRQFLEFNNFSVSSGPDLFVTLNQKSNPNSGSLGSHIKLGRLQSTSGNQRYDVTGIDLSDYQSLAIYCDRFSKVFGAVEL